MASTNLFVRPDDVHVPMQASSKQTHASKLSPGAVPKTVRAQLGVDFQPSEHSVICVRGKQHNSTGNSRFRKLASVFVKRYSQADTKTSKAAIVFNVITIIRQAGGQFCKFENGAWFEVGDHCARGKVSAFFRDMLHTKYRSSAKSKTIRRTLQKTQAQLYGQRLLSGNGGHCDDSSVSSSCAGRSKDSLGFDYSLEIDCSDIDVFYSSRSSPFSGSGSDSLGFDYRLEIDFFDIDVF